MQSARDRVLVFAMVDDWVTGDDVDDLPNTVVFIDDADGDADDADGPVNEKTTLEMGREGDVSAEVVFL
jgi:hypothetical protein